MKDSVRRRTEATALGFWLGLLLCLGTIAVRYYHQYRKLNNFALSHSAAFERVSLGRTREGASIILKNDGIQCFADGQNRCEFSDYWRAYVIYTNPVSHLVTRKSFGYKKRP